MLMQRKHLIVAALLTLGGSATAHAQIVYAAEHKSNADIKVYVSKYKSDADLAVYKAKYKSDVDGNNGIWFFTDYKTDAKKNIYFTDYKSDADLIIYFTDYKTDAGWLHRDKKQLMY